MLKSEKFQYKVLKVFFLIGVLPLLIISASSFFIVFEFGRNNIIELQNLAIENANEKIIGYLNKKMEVFNLVVGGIPSSIGEVDLSNLNYFMNNLKVLAGDVVEISFVDPNGNELAKSSDFGEPILQNIKDREDFLSAYSGRNYFGKIMFGNKKAYIRLSSQIENSNREIIGVITAMIDLQSMDKSIRNIKLGKIGYVYLADSEGRFIAGSLDNLSDLGANLGKREYIKEIISGLSPAKKIIRRATNFNNEEVVYDSKKIADAGWHIISEWPKNDAYKVIYRILIQSFLLLVATVIFVIIVGILATKKIIGPIKYLTDIVNKISAGDLDQKIRLRTNDEFEMLGDEFNRMTDVLKENKKLRDEFVFIAAHELRTPVTAIKGFVSMILEDSFGAIGNEVRKSLQTVQKANNRLVQLVQDLLEIARSESGKMAVNLESVNLKNNIKDIIAQLKPLADEKNITIKYRELETEIMVSADSDKLNEVLVNIIGNAIKYTLVSGDIEVYHEIKNNQELITHIKDHGMGMTEAEVVKLFSKFYRVQNSQTLHIEGTGLGLFICKEIIEKMAGRIWVVSAKGEGSVFSFDLKIVKLEK